MNHNSAQQRHPSAGAAVSGAERADASFFAALLASDAGQLQLLLDDRFLIVDVLGGGVVDREGFIAAIGSGRLRFSHVDVIERATRRYADTAIVVGRTQMSGSFDGEDFAAASRYTHVLARGAGGTWRLVNAQGTQIHEAAEPRGDVW